MIAHRNQSRILDANFNRAKEGLRVCEDICRFILNKKKTTQEFKNLRHQLTEIISSSRLKNYIKSRDIETDVGKESTLLELKRKNTSDIFYSNVQRVKESVRVLEEFTKMDNQKRAQQLKDIRYKIYALEKRIVKQL